MCLCYNVIESIIDSISGSVDALNTSLPDLYARTSAEFRDITIVYPLYVYIPFHLLPFEIEKDFVTIGFRRLAIFLRVYFFKLRMRSSRPLNCFASRRPVASRALHY